MRHLLACLRVKIPLEICPVDQMAETVAKAVRAVIADTGVPFKEHWNIRVDQWPEQDGKILCVAAVTTGNRKEWQRLLAVPGWPNPMPAEMN